MPKDCGILGVKYCSDGFVRSCESNAYLVSLDKTYCVSCPNDGVYTASCSSDGNFPTCKLNGKLVSSD